METMRQSSRQLLFARKQFEILLSRKTNEAEWQKFFTEHSYVLSTALPLKLRPRDIIPMARPGKTEPDFIFYPRDIKPIPFYGAIELKRPDSQIISVPRKNIAILSRDAETAIEQAHSYINNFPILPVNKAYDMFCLGNDSYIFVIMGMSSELSLKLTDNIFYEMIQNRLPKNLQIIPYDVLFNKFASKIPPKIYILVPQDEYIDKKSEIINSKFVFKNFVVGPWNQFAHAAAGAVASSPGKSYNPLFIYSSDTLSKTHLMHAIVNKILETNSNFKVLHTSAEQFNNEFVFSMRNGRLDKFKEKYRNLDVLLIYDIQFIAGKSGTQEELFHTFNALYDSHKQIVLLSDRSPKDISQITERLRSRFGLGLIADIQLPDIETKMAILGNWAQIEGIDLPEDVIGFLAGSIKSNISDLHACMMMLRGYSSLTGKAITVDMTKDVLKDFIHDEERHRP